jgi:simple sugar transport system ATP-binding protein
LRRLDAGEVRIAKTVVTNDNVARHRAAGLAYIPEDRANVGAALAATGAETLAMGFQRDTPLSKAGLLDGKAMASRARELIGKFGVRIASERTLVGSMSGGNLQKMVVARELSHEAKVLIAEQPTRGVDVGATEFIHGQLLAERDKGRAILLVSAELSEILALSDRVLVMYEGRILADVPRGEANEQSLGLLMAGRAASP